MLCSSNPFAHFWLITLLFNYLLDYASILTKDQLVWLEGIFLIGTPNNKPIPYSAYWFLNDDGDKGSPACIVKIKIHLGCSFKNSVKMKII